MADHNQNDLAKEGILWGAVLVVLLAVLIWWKAHDAIRYGVLWSAYYLLMPFTGISETAVRIQQSILSHPLDFWTPQKLFALYEIIAALFWRWPVIAILVAMALIVASRSKRLRYRHTLNLKTLAAMMVKENPHIAPTLKFNAFEQPLTGGLLPAPQRPIDFAVHYGLLLDGEGNPVSFDAIFRKNGTLRDFLPGVRDGFHPIGGYPVPARVDEAAAARIFAQQLCAGFPKLAGGFDVRTDLRKLPEWAQALAAAIYAMGAGRQKESDTILTALSLGWNPPQEAKKGGFAWKGSPIGWRSNADILAGRIDWQLTTNPAQPVELDDSYLSPSWSWWPAVAVRKSKKGHFGRDIVWRAYWRWPSKPFQPDVPARKMGFGKLDHLPYRALLKDMLQDTEFANFTRLHGSHVATWFMSLMEWAQRAGSFHTSLFIWLRMQNPTLFWVLNQVGGECAWTQAAGPWAHYRTEIMARQTIPEPCVDLAVEALVQELRTDGWLDPEYLK